MFVRTNASRQNYRLGRSASKIVRSYSLPAGHHSSSSLIRSWRASSIVPMRSSCQANRGMATAVSSHFTTTAQDSETSLYQLRPFDPTQPMILKEPSRPPIIKRPNAKGITGDIEMAIPVYEACLRVGKLDRAQLILERIEQLGGVSPQQQMRLNNQYLEANINKIKAEPNIGRAEELHAWYETHIHGAGIPQSPETIAYMLKASLLTTTSEGTRLTRLIKRYMGMVPPEQGLDVLYCTDILTDSDIATITQHYPEFNISTFTEDVEPIDLETELPTISKIINDSSMHSNRKDPPEVLPTPQKGMGLQTVQSTLDIFQKMKGGHDISTLPLHERREFQSRLERDCIDMAIERWRDTDDNLKKMGLSSGLSSGLLNEVLSMWQNDVEAVLKEEFNKIQEAEEATHKSEADVDRCQYGPILMQSTPERLSAVSILSVLSAMTFTGIDKGAALSVVVNHVSKVLEEDIRTHEWEKRQKAMARKARQEFLQKRKASLGKATPTGTKATPSATQEATSSATQEVTASTAAEATTSTTSDIHASSNVDAKVPLPELATEPASNEDRVTYWPLALRTKLAAVLVKAITDVAKIKVVREDPTTMHKDATWQPAFTRCHQFKRGRRVGVLMPHPTLSEILRKEPNGEFLARHLPMVVQPEPWVRFDKGAYQESSVPLIRIKSGEQDQRLYAEAAFDKGDLVQITKGLDVLGKTAWRINRPVFNVLLEAWNKGEAIAKIPPLEPDLPIPPEPDASADPLVRRQWIKTLKNIHNLKMGYHSQRCFMNFQLEIARAYRDQEFYFPHNVDFRGRAYPIPTYLNHMGADHMRGLLRFAKSRELGEKGLKWLKVHLANVYGYDKASLSDREAFAMENMDNILDSARNPLNGNRWWLSAEDPWQCLAACYELTAAYESPDPTKFKSSLPVHQDGTCNGLQHYAALGGDAWGASQVNLSPGDKPADVYSAVANLVIEGVDKDAELGNPMAKAMVGKIKRKVVKQTVMTNVYGVTFSGAKKQVLKQINALYPDIEEETGVGAGLIASYIATRIFKALGTMFKGAHDIQYWLGEIGGRVCRALTPEQIKEVTKSDVEPAWGVTKAKKISSKDDIGSLFRSTIIWTTPLRMPIVQPYRKSNNKVVHTCVQTLTLQNTERFDPVDRRKQLQAFPPNFIHSLDASHMMLSALECHELGLDFAAVHDSFWTHAADVDVMNRVLRDAFIRIHGEDVIKRLLAEFETRYSGGLYLARVDKTTEAGKEISMWRRKASQKMTAREELVIEKKRIDLLNSSDPQERAAGEAMVTPGSIFDALGSAEGTDIVEDDLSGPGLGSMSESAASSDSVDGDDGAVPSEDGGEARDAARDASTEALDSDPQDYFKQYSTVSHFEERLSGKKNGPAKPSRKVYETTHAWLPLRFPPVPKKGDFDVEELRGSKYFFS